MTYTYAILEVSAEAYDEIAGKLRDAEYDHAFHDEGEDGTVIDMHGIALKRGGQAVPINSELLALVKEAQGDWRHQWETLPNTLADQEEADELDRLIKRCDAAIEKAEAT